MNGRMDIGLFLLLAFGFAGYARDVLIQKVNGSLSATLRFFCVLLYTRPAREPDDIDCTDH